MSLPPQASFAAWLAEQEQQIQENVVTARDYYDGDQNAEMNERIQEFVGMAVDNRFAFNYCRGVVSAVVDRLKVQGFITGDDGLDDWLRLVWQQNRMDAKQVAVHRGAVCDGQYFVIVDWDEENKRPRITPHPRYTDPLVDGTGFGCKAHYPDDDPSAPMTFASKRWRERARDDRGQTVLVQRMNLYYSDRVERYQIWGGGSDAEWQPMDVLPWVDSANQPLGIPVFRFANPSARSELWDAVPVQDAINKTALDLLAEGDVTAMRMLVARGFMPTTDGKAPDSSGSNYLKMFPGMWIGPVKPEGGVDVIEGSKLDPLINTLDSLIFKLAQITDTPLSRFQVTRQIASDETQKQGESPLIAKVELRQTTFGNSWEDALGLCRRLANMHGEKWDEEAHIESQWVPAEVRDQNADEVAFWAAAKSAKEAGCPLPAYLELRGWDQDKIDVITDSAEYQGRMAMYDMASLAGSDES